MTEESKTKKIHSFRWEEFQDRIAKINKKAKKLGLPEVGFTEVGRKHFKALDMWEDFGPRPAFDMIEVELFGDAPYIQGWTLLAVFEHTPDFGEALIHTVPGQKVPEEFRGSKAVCQHCNKVRSRKDTFLLRSQDNNHLIIGRNCLADFLPGINPAMAASLCSHYGDKVFTGDDEFGDFDFSNRIRWDHADVDLIRLWSITSAVVRNYGWLPKSKALDGSIPTSALVSKVIYPPMSFFTQEERRNFEELLRKAQPTEKDKETAQQTMDWLLNEVGSNDEYLYNLKVIAKTGKTNSRNMSLSVSAVASYLRHLDGLERRKATKDGASEYQGKVGQRFRGIALEVYTVRYWDNHFGTVTFVGFKDTKGNIFTWKASSSLDINRGEKYLVTGTVKEHSIYKGVCQTVLSRCKLEKVPDEGPKQMELELHA